MLGHELNLRPLRITHDPPLNPFTQATAARIVPHFALCHSLQVEAGSYEEAAEAARAGADIVMLDNFEPSHLKSVSHELKKEFPQVTLEASGGITGDTFHQFLCDSVDVISQGSLTHGYSCIDFSLKIGPS